MFKLEKQCIEYENKSLRLPVDLIREVQNLADRYEMSFNKVVIQCVRYALSHMEQEQDTDFKEVQ